MEVLKYMGTFVIGFLTILISDYIWLGYIIKKFTIQEFGSLIVVENGSIKVNLGAGLLAWASIVLLLFIFVVKGQNSSLSTLLYGGLFGGLLYAMYDLTNLTFIKNYSLMFTIVDITWGMILCALVSFIMYIFLQFIHKIF